MYLSTIALINDYLSLQVRLADNTFNIEYTNIRLFNTGI